MPLKILPIRIHEKTSKFDGITHSLPIGSRAYVALIVSAPVLLWYGKIVPEGSCLYGENTSDSWDIPQYTTRECCITSISQTGPRWKDFLHRGPVSGMDRLLRWITRVFFSTNLICIIIYRLLNNQCSQMSSCFRYIQLEHVWIPRPSPWRCITDKTILYDPRKSNACSIWSPLRFNVY